MSKKLLKVLAALTAAMTAFAATAFGADYPIIEKVENGEVVNVDGTFYKAVGENLFKNSTFNDNSGKDMEQWYVGVNTAGHPTVDNYQIPKILPDGTIENLMPLTDSGLLTTGVFEQHGENTFYYGTDKENHYLVEQIDNTNGTNWQSCAWNGANSLLAFVPVKPNSKYVFSYRAYSADGKASVRYGAVNMENYVPTPYAENGALNFSGTGSVNCNNGGVQNVGGAWTTYETVIDTGDGDYFLFNAYWLQMSSYLCLDDFKLYEIEKADAGVEVTGAQVRIAQGVAADGKIQNAALESSGLRFVVTINPTDTIASLDGAVFGVEIVPKDKPDATPVDIEARFFQNETTYTAALVNLLESNYNRTFVATPYVKIGETKYYGKPLERSIYQVSAGLMKEQEITGAVYDVLNAYLNEVGVRVNIDKTNGKAATDTVYTGDVFFTVTESAKTSEGYYTVTVELGREFATKPTLMEKWWTDYVRVNNNNTTAKTYIEDVKYDKSTNTLTFVFDPKDKYAAE